MGLFSERMRWMRVRRGCVAPEEPPTWRPEPCGTFSPWWWEGGPGGEALGSATPPWNFPPPPPPPPLLVVVVGGVRLLGSPPRPQGTCGPGRKGPTGSKTRTHALPSPQCSPAQSCNPLYLPKVFYLLSVIISS